VKEIINFALAITPFFFISAVDSLMRFLHVPFSGSDANGRKEGRRKSPPEAVCGSIEDSTYSLGIASKKTNENYFFRRFYHPRLFFFLQSDAVILACSAGSSRKITRDFS